MDGDDRFRFVRLEMKDVDAADDTLWLRFDAAQAVGDDPPDGLPRVAVVRPRDRGARYTVEDVFPGRHAMFVETIGTPNEDAERYALPDRLFGLLETNHAFVSVGLGPHTLWLSRRIPAGRPLVVELSSEEARKAGEAARDGVEWGRVRVVLVPTEEDKAAFRASLDEAGVEDYVHMRLVPRWNELGPRRS